MAWQSYLTIDGVMIGTWFNSAPDEALLLFTESQLSVNDDQVRWTATAQAALQCLASAGFHWQAVVADYGDARQFSPAMAFLCGLMCAERQRAMGVSREMGTVEINAEYERFVADLNCVPPGEELKELGQLALQQAVDQQAHWESGKIDDELERRVLETLLLEHHTEPADPLCILPRALQGRLGRPLEYLSHMRRQVPAVGWLFSMVTVLQGLRSDAVVVLDITEGASPKYSDLPLDEFAHEFWSSAQQALTRSANLYGRIFGTIATATSGLGESARYGTLASMLQQLSEPGASRAARGRNLEDLVAGIVGLHGTGLEVLARNVKHEDEELDLVLRNDLAEPFWRNFNSPIVLVECKNWSSRVDVGELRILQTKMQDRGRLCSVGLFIGLHGFTRPFLERVRDLQTQNITIFPIEQADLENIIHTQQRLAEWLRDAGLKKVL